MTPDFSLKTIPYGNKSNKTNRIYPPVATDIFLITENPLDWDGKDKVEINVPVRLFLRWQKYEKH